MAEVEDLFWCLKTPITITVIKCKVFESRLFSSFAFNKHEVERWLGDISFDEFSAAYSDLLCLLDLARIRFRTSARAGTLSAEACLAIEDDDYLILKNHFQNPKKLPSGMQLKSNFNELQFYVLIALKEVTSTYHFIAASNKLGDDAGACNGAMVFALSSSLAAQRILTDVQREVYFRTAKESIDSMSEDIKAAKRPQRKGGEWTRFNDVKPLFISLAFKKWREQENNGEEVFRKTDMVNYLRLELKARCPLTDTNPPRHHLPESDTIWDWIVASGEDIPKNARKRGRARGKKGLAS